MANKMWMGIPYSHAQWVPCPLIDSTVTRKRRVETIDFYNGGGDVSRSNQYQMQYNISLNDLAHEVEGIDAFNRFASGLYGEGYIYLAYPTHFDTNLFSAQWSTPSLADNGWTNSIHPNVSFESWSPPSGSNLPDTRAVFLLSGAANEMSRKFTIAVPPGFTLIYGITGGVSGSAVVKQRVINSDSTFSDNNVSLIAVGSTGARFNSHVDGGTNGLFVQFFLTKTTSAPSDVILAGMDARLVPTSEYSVSHPYFSDKKHVMGEGSTGLMFVDDAIVETYSYMYPPRKAISTNLIEVEAWR